MRRKGLAMVHWLTLFSWGRRPKINKGWVWRSIFSRHKGGHVHQQQVSIELWRRLGTYQQNLEEQMQCEEWQTILATQKENIPQLFLLCEGRGRGREEGGRERDREGGRREIRKGGREMCVRRRGGSYWCSTIIILSGQKLLLHSRKILELVNSLRE